ncbi:MAG: putative toxin-antitoxin system toxin component, PIN family [Spirosoma sp.]|nr:putative toxin-antitoxin system toxin component, PIN family [Spirosoma sp.]
MPAIKHNVVIDTYLWISFLLTKNYERMDQLFALDRLTLLVSQELLDEMVAVAERPKFRKYFALTALTDLLASLR